MAQEKQQTPLPVDHQLLVDCTLRRFVQHPSFREGNELEHFRTHNVYLHNDEASSRRPSTYQCSRAEV